VGRDNLINLSSCTYWSHGDPYVQGLYYLGRLRSIPSPVELYLMITQWSLRVGFISLRGNWNINLS